jgi:WD40 repeat protein
MSPRTQRFLWIILAVIALCLTAVTAGVYVESRRRSLTAGAAFRLAYTSIQEDAQQTPSGQLLSCDLRGRNVAQLTETNALDAFAASEPLHVSTSEAAQIAFLRLQSETQSDPHSSETDVGMLGGVYVVSARGGQVRKVSGVLTRVWTVAPSWSPDGKQVAFAAVEDLNSDGRLLIDEVGIYVCDAVGTQCTRIATIGSAVTRLLWSPAGAQLIVTSIQSDGLVSRLLDAQTGESILDGHAPAACWSPDGMEIAAYVADDDKVYVLRPDESESYELDPPPGRAVQLLWIPTWPASELTKRGRLVSVSEPEHASGPSQLYIRSPEPGAETWQHLIDLENYVMHVAASPDGRYLAFTLLTAEPSEASEMVPPADLYLLEIGQKQPVRLSSAPGLEGLATWISLNTD